MSVIGHECVAKFALPNRSRELTAFPWLSQHYFRFAPFAQLDSLRATIVGLMTKTRTFFALALSALLGTTLLPYIAAQQLDAKSWGKNSPGITLALREGPRQKTAQGTLLLYNVLGRGFPSGIPYELWQWKAGQEPRMLMQGVSFDKRGVMVCSGQAGFCKGSVPDDPVNIKATAQPGESKRVAVLSPDRKIAGFAEALPFPVQH